MRTLARFATALVTTTIVVGATATTAHAQTTTVKDKASDVLSFTDQSTDTRGTQLGYRESVASGVDLRSLRAKHTKKSVAIRVKFADLGTETLPIIGLRLDDDSEPSRFVVVSASGEADVINAHGTKRCTVPLTAQLGASGYLNVVVKRSCLAAPKRVKVSVFAAREGFQGHNTPYMADTVSPDSVRGDGWTTWLKAG
jgi:hypothetical protein